MEYLSIVIFDSTHPCLRLFFSWYKKKKPGVTVAESITQPITANNGAHNNIGQKNNEPPRMEIILRRHPQEMAVERLSKEFLRTSQEATIEQLKMFLGMKLDYSPYCDFQVCTVLLLMIDWALNWRTRVLWSNSWMLNLICYAPPVSLSIRYWQLPVRMRLYSQMIYPWFVSVERYVTMPWMKSYSIIASFLPNHPRRTHQPPHKLWVATNNKLVNYFPNSSEFFSSLRPRESN